METKTHSVDSVQACQNCKKDFVIAPDDFSFYEKIQVPPPTFCPECRMIRRLAWRNERSLHKRECGLCKKPLISMYPKDNAPVHCTECWNGNGWDQFAFAKDYDFTRPFFDQLRELFKINPRFYAYKFGNFVNSEFVNFAKDNKNCYLSYSVIECEDILYSTSIDKSKNSTDCLSVIRLDGCFENVSCEGNYNTHYAIKSQNCVDSYFLYDCVNCSNCFMSSNLRNQQYFFKNQKCSKEEYLKKVSEYKLNTYSGIQKTKAEFKYMIINEAFHKYAFIYASLNVTGDYVHHARNIKNSSDVYESENISHSYRVLYSKDAYDSSGCGYGEIIYETMAATSNTFRDFFCYLTIEGCRECQYSMVLKNCSDCFGCVGLTNAKYCIFNKQYEKEEYFEVVEKIKRHMSDMPYRDKKGRVFKYGEFFPYDMSPFGYNETNAHDFFPMKKEEAEEKGYNWKEKEKKDYKITVDSADLPDDIHDVSDDILNEVISCPNNGGEMTQCTNAFKIVPAELQFYKQKNLPLPRFCPNCRHYERLKYRNPMKLWHRKCMKENCNNEFETSYSPERPEIIYCEKCYQQEAY
jgi:hypothetical protein